MAQDGEDQQKRQEEIVELAPTNWPRTIGIVSISWATLGLSCLACGVALQVALGPSMLPEPLRNNPPPSMRFGTLQIVQTIISLVTSSLLIAAGIQTLRRSFSGRTLHLIWAVLSVLAVIYGGFAGWHQQQEQLIWARENPDNPIAKQTLQGQPFSLAIMGFFLCFFAAWPVFCLTWFGLIKRTAASFGAPPDKDFI